MGKYDDITPEQLRADLVQFAKLILRLDEEDGVLTSPADLQKIIGELRQKLFAYEIRAGRLARGERKAKSPGEREDPSLKRSLKVVREALRREEEMLREWEGDDEEEDELDG